MFIKNLLLAISCDLQGRNVWQPITPFIAYLLAIGFCIYCIADPFKTIYKCGAWGIWTLVLPIFNKRISHAYLFDMWLVIHWGWPEINTIHHSISVLSTATNPWNRELSVWAGLHLSVSKQVLLSLFRQQLYKCCQLLFWCLSISLCMFSYQITSNQIQIMPLGKWIHFILKECPNKVKSVSSWNLIIKVT